MKGATNERACELGAYIKEHKATVRAAAKQFHISKSTVHKDVAERLKLCKHSRQRMFLPRVRRWKTIPISRVRPGLKCSSRLPTRWIVRLAT